MKLRYYLRGLGLGILVTAIFFLVSGRNTSRPMSDEMVKARAKELGMIESTVLAKLSEEETNVEESVIEESVAEETTIEETAIEETTIEETTIEETTIEETTIEETTIEEITIEETTEEETAIEEILEVETVAEEVSTEEIIIVVNRGEGSDTVSRRLAEAGLVADAHEYDRYLMQNGYDKRIGAGEHKIPANASWEEIAKILCS